MKLVLMMVAFILAGFAPANSGSTSTLEVLARPGPWPVADNLIVYRNKVWFSSAVKGVNHNSADVWSYSPSTKTTRFERYLFSQDAGRPTVHSGLLYWPFEDMRAGLGKGIVSVTNGRSWKNLYLPSKEYMMHTHSLMEWRGQLVAAMAGWHSSISVSKDRGLSWKAIVSDAPRVGSFHRYNDLTKLGDQLFAKHWEIDGLKLSRFVDGKMIDLEDWPQCRDMSRFVEFNKALYTIVDLKSGLSVLWQIDANGHRAVGTMPEDLELRALANDGEKLWVVTKSVGGGELWASGDGISFTLQKSFEGGVAFDAVAMDVDTIFVSGEGDDGKAILWGPGRFQNHALNRPIARLPFPPVPKDIVTDFTVLKSQLQTALMDDTLYGRHGSALRTMIFEILAQDPPDDFFRSLLELDFPETAVDVYGGQFTVPAREIATWLLINAMEQNREATVPLRYLTGQWLRLGNGPQKWFDPLLAAMRAIQLIGQDDQATIEALIARLDFDDPDWLKSQVTGTLAALTRQPFAHNEDRWKNWWVDAREDWPIKPQL